MLRNPLRLALLEDVASAKAEYYLATAYPTRGTQPWSVAAALPLRGR